MTLTEKQRFWYEHVQQCQQTEQSMAAYAAEHDLDLKAFYNWKSILVKRGALASTLTRSTFTEVRVESSALPYPCHWVIHFPNGCRLEAPIQDAALLRATLRELLVHS